MGGNTVDEEEEVSGADGAEFVNATVLDEEDAVMIDFFSLVRARMELVLGIPIWWEAWGTPMDDDEIGAIPV